MFLPTLDTFPYTNEEVLDILEEVTEKERAEITSSLKNISRRDIPTNNAQFLMLLAKYCGFTADPKGAEIVINSPNFTTLRDQFSVRLIIDIVNIIEEVLSSIKKEKILAVVISEYYYFSDEEEGVE